MPVMNPNNPPIGLIQIFKEIPEDNDGEQKLKSAYNYDCTTECPGHMTYMEGCNLIL
jgi:hypothetical protein